jgi:hypothetical protein
MPRFVILEHDHPSLHWDFMIEVGDVLRTWRLSEPPTPGHVVPAEPSFDHRPFYLDYEGPVSGDRGTVKRWDAGTYRVVDEAPGRLLLHLEGGTLSGQVALEREVDAACWRLLASAHGSVGGDQSASSG